MVTLSTHPSCRRLLGACMLCALLPGLAILLTATGCSRESPSASTGEFGDVTTAEPPPESAGSAPRGGTVREDSTVGGMPGGTGAGDAVRQGGTGTGLSGNGIVNDSQ